jgi:hypothetical protein
VFDDAQQYQFGTYTKSAPVAVNAWKIVYPPWSFVTMRWHAFRQAKRRGERRTVMSFHASNFDAVSRIAALGFQRQLNLGKWFGDGIYQSAIADVCAFYAARFYSQRGDALLVLSETTLGQYQRVKTFLPNQQMHLDTHVVLHTAGARLGMTHADMWFWVRPLARAIGWGYVTGQEIVCRDESQILPKFIVNIHFTPL